MAHVIYEFPLNEKIRTYLRIEHLLQRMEACSADLSEKSLLNYFEALFAVAEVIERGDLRGDFLKDLEKHEKNLVTWAQHPDIDSSAINGLLQQIVNATTSLNKSGRLGSEIKEDKFLSSIKQRFSIPGGTCCFDLPHLHHWLNQSDEQKKQDIERWSDYLATLKQVIELDLKFVRERGQSTAKTAVNGFFQDATENTELLQITIDSSEKTYPTVSGNKHRFSIRFMETCAEQGKAASEADVNFKLACC